MPTLEVKLHSDVYAHLTDEHKATLTSKGYIVPSEGDGGDVGDGGTKSNGVYAVAADGELIDYNLADETALGVALVAGEHKFMIAKSEATNDGSNYYLYWGKNLYEQDVPNLEYLADETAAKADYNGKANTAAIIAGYAALGKDMDSRDMCKVLEAYNEGGYTDWYVPACGQLYEIFTYKTNINTALTNIGGTTLDERATYWSSSELDINDGWAVTMDYGDIYNLDKNYAYYVRFIRDLQ